MKKIALAFLCVFLLIVPAVAQIITPITKEKNFSLEETVFYEDSVANDPFEEWNRRFFHFNMALDRAVLRPVARTYQEYIPRQARTSIRHFLNNLREPLYFINSLLQGDLERAGTAWTRFFVNSTFGMAGLFDVAASEGIDIAPEDFGQTLAVWGVGEGFYMMVPLLGPSNPRDLLGFGVDWVMNPVSYGIDSAGLEKLDYGQKGINLIDRRASTLDVIDTLEANSVDFYAATRNFYRQLRAREIANDTMALQSFQEADDAFNDFFAE